MPIPIALVIGGGIAILLAYAKKDKKRKVFVSYYFDEDKHYKRLLKAWSANGKFRLNFDDISTDISVKSENENYIKRTISNRIKECDVFLVIIGKKTHKRKWVAWEISKALEYKKKIVALKENKSHATPKELMSVGAEWVYGFKEEKVRNSIHG